MTDNEIIKAFEHCVNKRSCIGCIAYSRRACRIDEGPLDLINRQKAEINEKDELIERLQNANVRALRGTTESAKANARAEAIKEFAERLKKRLDRKYTVYGREYVFRHIRDLVKEMVGEEE